MAKLRALLLIAIGEFISEAYPQVLLGSAVLCGSMVLHLKYKPFHSGVLNFLESAALFTGYVTYVGTFVVSQIEAPCAGGTAEGDRGVFITACIDGGGEPSGGAVGIFYLLLGVIVVLNAGMLLVFLTLPLKAVEALAKDAAHAMSRRRSSFKRRSRAGSWFRRFSGAKPSKGVKEGPTMVEK